MKDVEDARHVNAVPQHQPFSLSYTYDHVATQLDDEPEHNQKDGKECSVNEEEPATSCIESKPKKAPASTGHAVATYTGTPVALAEKSRWSREDMTEE